MQLRRLQDHLIEQYVIAARYGGDRLRVEGIGRGAGLSLDVGATFIQTLRRHDDGRQVGGVGCLCDRRRTENDETTAVATLGATAATESLNIEKISAKLKDAPPPCIGEEHSTWDLQLERGGPRLRARGAVSIDLGKRRRQRQRGPRAAEKRYAKGMAERRGYGVRERRA